MGWAIKFNEKDAKPNNMPTKGQHHSTFAAYLAQNAKQIFLQPLASPALAHGRKNGEGAAQGLQGLVGGSGA